MADGTNLDQLWARLAAAHARGQARQAELTAAPGRAAAPGDVYLGVPPDEHVLAWAVVSDHPADSELVYVVPADGHPLAGLADVAVRDPAGEPLYLRCGRGLWVRRADLAPNRRCRVLGPHHLRRARLKIRQIATGPLDGPTAAWQDEADPAYHDWMDGVTAAVLAAAAGQESSVLPGFVAALSGRPAGGVGAGPDIGVRASTGSGFEATVGEPALAAAGTDPFSHPPAPAAPVEGLGRPLPFDGPGRLVVVHHPAGVAVIFEGPPSAAPPPVSAADASGDWQPLAWEFTPDRAVARATAPWLGGQVRLRVGAGAVEETVIKP